MTDLPAITPAVATAAKFDPELERLRLWVASGGRCAMCNMKLLGHEFTALNVLTGEGAHVVGRKNSTRSPRGFSPLPEAMRDFAENIVLLCPTDHEMIDKWLGQQVWTVTDLQNLKRRHEDRIDYLTGLGEDAETVVLRLIGDIRGAAVECSAESVRAAVHQHHRYPRYELGVRSKSDIEIDLRDFPGEGDAEYWRFTEKKIAKTVEQLKTGVHDGHVRHLSVFAFARISVLVLLGSRLDDKIPTELFDHHRDGSAWKWAIDEEPITFEFERIAGEDGADRIVLLASISGTVAPGDLNDDLLDGAAVYELRPVGTDPKLDLIRVPETLAAFSATYRAFLAHIEHAHPAAAAIDVVGALPLTAAIEIGRRRLRDVHPPLHVWERKPDGGYSLGMEIT
jgi:hypothetical protein